MIISLGNKQFETYIANHVIEGAITSIANAIERDYRNVDEAPVLLSVLNGGFIFCASLCTKINLNVYIEFMKVSSYIGDKATGQNVIQSPLLKNIHSKHIIIIEDIWDTGGTCSVLSAYLQKQSDPKSIKIACLFSKPEAHKPSRIKPDYVGLDIVNEFVVGYGLDYNGLGRNLTDLYKVVP